VTIRFKMDLDQIRSDWHKIGSDNYFVRRLYDCDSVHLAGWALVPSPDGGPFLRLRRSPTFVDVVSNTGARVLACGFDFIESSTVFSVFWCVS
jgi:hypothetical protein